MKGLIIKSPYIDLILIGKKKWEIRGHNTSVRGKIYLIKSGSKKIYGEVDLIDCIELDLKKYKEYCLKVHGENKFDLPYKKTYAWVLENPVLYEEPVSYSHPIGAVIWVNL